MQIPNEIIFNLEKSRNATFEKIMVRFAMIGMISWAGPPNTLDSGVYTSWNPNMYQVKPSNIDKFLEFSNKSDNHGESASYQLMNTVFKGRTEKPHGKIRLMHHVNFSSLEDVLTAENAEEIFKSKSKLIYHTFAYIRDAMKFKVEFKLGDLIISYPNGSFTESGFKLISGEYDISVETRSFVAQRARNLSLLVPSLEMRAMAIFVPPIGSSFEGVQSKPFTWHLWLAFFLVRSVCLLGALMSMKFSNHHQQDYKELQWNSAPMCQQGCTGVPRNFSGRLVFLSAMVLSTFLYWIYSAKIYSFLSTEIIPIKNYKDLKKNKHLNLIADDGSSSIFNFIQGDLKRGVPIRRGGIQETIAPLFNGTTALITYLEDFATVMKNNGHDHDTCRLDKFVSKMCRVLATVPLVLGTKGGMLASKKFKYKEHVNILLTAFIENGLRRKFAAEVLDTQLMDCRPKAEILSSIELTHCFLCYSVLVLGIFLSLLIVIYEKETLRNRHRAD